MTLSDQLREKPEVLRSLLDKDLQDQGGPNMAETLAVLVPVAPETTQLEPASKSSRPDPR